MPYAEIGASFINSNFISVWFPVSFSCSIDALSLDTTYSFSGLVKWSKKPITSVVAMYINESLLFDWFLSLLLLFELSCFYVLALIVWSLVTILIQLWLFKFWRNVTLLIFFGTLILFLLKKFEVCYRLGSSRMTQMSLNYEYKIDKLSAHMLVFANIWKFLVELSNWELIDILFPSIKQSNNMCTCKYR